ncbi:HU family DNA-binding protein [Embleya sp. AB8]|uniref:HU family DNA-binding protein n=1 Tax=Embleya sp. AB8 TaxID=3156304 RepID=UPI003C721370
MTNDRTLAADALNTALETIVAAVAEGNDVSITGFGTFHRAHRAARTMRNPQAGEAMDVKASGKPAFRPGAAFKDRVNK